MRRFTLGLAVAFSPCVAFADTKKQTEVVVKTGHAESRHAIQRKADSLLSDFRKDWDVADASDLIEVKVSISDKDAAGSSSYQLVGANGYPRDIELNLSGKLEAIVQDVLPRQLSQVVLAERVGVPPRWAGMGVGLLAESRRKQNRNWERFRELRDSGALMATKKLLEYTQYPSEAEELNTMYVQSMAFTDFIVSTWSREKFVEFLADSKVLGVPLAIQEHFDLDNVGELDLAFRQWAAVR